jgi:hypothetical protein
MAKRRAKRRPPTNTPARKRLKARAQRVRRHWVFRVAIWLLTTAGAAVVGAAVLWAVGVINPFASDEPTLEEWGGEISNVCRGLTDDMTAVRGMPLRTTEDDLRRNRAAAAAWRRAGDVAQEVEIPSDHAGQIHEFLGLFDAAALTYQMYAFDVENGLNPSAELRARDRIWSRWQELGIRLQARGCTP